MAIGDTLDYSPLRRAATKADIDQLNAHLLKTDPTNNLLIKHKAAMIATAAVFYVALFGAILFGSADIRIFSLLAAMIISIIIAGLYFYVRGRKAKVAKLYSFAQKNGFGFHTEVSSPDLPGIIFQQGDSRNVPEVLILKDKTEIGNFQYYTGSGKSRKVHNWGYMRIPLARNLPNIVLDSKQNNVFNNVSNLPVVLTGASKLELEGDFNKYFTLYVPQGYERDALYVFTPNVMQTLIASGANYDLEIIDNHLVVYRPTRFSLDSEAELKSVLNTFEVIANELRRQTMRYADERVENAKVENIVAESGARINEGISPREIFVLVAGVVIILLIAADIFGLIDLGR